MPNFNSIGSGFSEPQVAEYRHLPLTGGIALTTVLHCDAQLSQRDRAAGCVIVFAKNRRLELGDNILQTL